jgi:hypothetical protein
MSIVHALSTAVEIPAAKVDDTVTIALSVETVIKDITAKVGRLCEQHNITATSVSAPNVTIQGRVVVATIAGVFEHAGSGTGSTGHSDDLPPEIDSVIDAVDAVGGSIDVVVGTGGIPDGGIPGFVAGNNDEQREYIERAIDAMRRGLAPEQFVAVARGTVTKGQMPVVSNGNPGPKPNMSGLF